MRHEGRHVPFEPLPMLEPAMLELAALESMFEPLPMVELMLLTIGGARRANIAKSVEIQ